MKGLIQTTIVFLFLNFLMGCGPTPTKVIEIESLIPENISAVIKIEDFEALKSDINNNDFLSKLKNTKPYTFFKEKNFFNYLHPSSKSLICISESNDASEVTFITKQAANLFKTDSIPNISIETVSFKKQSFQKLSIEEQVVFTAIKDSVFIASSSQQILQQILEGKTKKDPIFNKIIDLKNNQDVTAYVPANEILIDQLVFNFASWAALDVEILPDALTVSGVVLANDTIPQLISVFKGLQPQHNDIAKVTPTDALDVTSFTFNDFELFQKNLQKFRSNNGINNEEALLFESITEIGKISHPQGNAIVLKSLDPELTSDALESYRAQREPFKDVMIYDFNNPSLFTNLFFTFINQTNPTTVFKLDNFFVFSENETVTQHIITSFLNNNCLSSTTYYKESLSQLSDESSLQIIKLNGNYSGAISNVMKTEIEKINFKKYPLAILQFSYDRNFSHVNFVCKEASEKKQITRKVSQLASILLRDDIMGEINFFSNHRTGGKDIVAQDISNKLYFISAGGKTLWTKKLDGPILGSINDVDILRNGKKQLVFATKNNVYVLDRTGRNVGEFPIKFRDDITQPLSVFDYDNNRKYRFIITQGNEVFMIDGKGKRVKGFKFKKTKTDIVLPPQHIRMANKDYILIAEKSGKLNILSRVGKPRIAISKTFNFSEIPIAREGEKFVVITKDNIKNSISQNGKVSTLKLNVTSYWFTTKGKTKVTLDDNLMRINGKLVELPFGIYTAPKIFTVNRKTYISITETQENKVYLFNKLGELITGFPVFGTSTIDLADATKNGKVNFVSQGGNKEILLFELQ